MVKNILRFFRPATWSDHRHSGDDAHRRLRKLQWSVFVAITLGYGLFYVCRLSMSVVKKPIVDAGILDESQLGVIGSALFFSYAAGKFVNGFLADRSNIRRFMSTGLMISALVNLALGWTNWFIVFAILWGINGWFQAFGAGSCVVALSRWYSDENRGTFYGFWCSSHNIGEALTFVLTALVVSTLGWRWGFTGASVGGFLGVLLIILLLRDSPQSEGLHPQQLSAHEMPGGLTAEESVTEGQLGVLKSPAIWILALSSACMYVSRYAINSWGPFYLEAGKGYSTLQASSIVSIAPLCGIVGSIGCGWVSDQFFHSRRNLPAFLFGVMNCTSIGLLLFGPPGLVWLDMAAMAIYGIAIGALVAYLGGLMAVDIASRKAAGAALGVVGIASYIGAGLQDIISGRLIEANKTLVDGAAATYDFTAVSIFWLAAPIVSVLLALLVWKSDPACHKSESQEIE
ncbi:MAG: MFS transporter [Phycisphaeraceae bacterium]|nr:MFS transporter [Phycisphaeraceae bacterium]